MSCANTVTLKTEAGDEITISITFESNVNFTSYDYFIVYSDSDFNINTSLSSNYFFIPGESYSEISEVIIDENGGFSYYYDTYFDTWDGILKLNSNSIEQTTGSFDSDTSSESEQVSYIGEELSIPDYTVSNNTVSFTINISELSLNTNDLIISIIVRSSTNGSDTSLINVMDIAEAIEIPVISNQPAITGTNDSSLFSGSGGGKVESWSITVY